MKGHLKNLFETISYIVHCLHLVIKPSVTIYTSQQVKVQQIEFSKNNTDITNTIWKWKREGRGGRANALTPLVFYTGKSRIMFIVNNLIGTTKEIKNAYTPEGILKLLDSYYRTDPNPRSM